MSLVTQKFRIYTAAFLLLLCPQILKAQGVMIPTDGGQADFLTAYKFVLAQASSDYRFTNATMDTLLYPKWGEYSAYWIKSGPRKGSFVYPDVVPSSYSSVTSSPYNGYDWRSEDHYALSFKAYAKTVAILRSGIKTNNSSVSWEAVYFRNLFESFLYPGISYYTTEREIDSAGLVWTAQLLIIPAVAAQGSDWHAHIDSMFTASPRLKSNLLAFLARGGTIYTEGNSVYAIEKLGLLPPGAVDYGQSSQPDPETNTIILDMADLEHPVGFAKDAAGAALYSGVIPMVQTGDARIIARLQGTDIPVVFAMSGATANGGRVICNTALPTVGGSNGLLKGQASPEGRQLQWAVNAAMWAFATNIDVTRSVHNDLPDFLSVGRNAASFDRRDTLEIRVKIRNLSSSNISGIAISEAIRDFFTFVDVKTPDVTADYRKPTLILSGISVPARSEKVIVYRITTPDPQDPVHEKVNSYISWANYIYASYSTITYTDHDGAASYRKYRNYVDIMFSARLVADTDLNWKNFLGLYYQPFKVFMIMENKERTSAMNTRYVQYIPKDVPFYWTDKSIDIPILKTPGGKFVDVLRGSNDCNNPEFDMDGDGRPDAWLDTASIYPKNFSIEETAVYWRNPWEHLRSGNESLYEDVDHDGLRARDLDGDGIVDVEEPGDKIRVWKVTWDIGKVNGYQFHDPYCYFELWVDPPDLVPMSAGVGKAFGKLDENVAGMFYPYSPDVNAPDMSDTSWAHWMERDPGGMVRWKQLIYQKINNYEGFTFIDTAAARYKLRAADHCAGTVPQPHREFIAVLSLGGDEIDMNNPTPKKSDYSNLEYTTIFGEKRNTPIRTTYTYYAPLPNPLQFEYLTNNFSITDLNTGEMLRHLPAAGKAKLTFDIDASTEYSYYWIRNAGHDVDYNDPSEAIEGKEELGDGVFGYMMYEIPKGMGGYKITLPKRGDGAYDIDKIVQVDGAPYRPWLSNPNTADSVRIFEDVFSYHIHIPQLLIPPALDDDNFDGIDDWMDDRGDRFQSKTGFLHDAFMLGNGESYPDEPKKPFKDDIYGWVSSGWSAGADSSYGDDFFEALGKTHFTINALFEGSGREGSVDISKGGWLVVEEIFGGSPWVIFSHALTAWSQGVNYSLTSSVTPAMARYGVDTVYIKHVIEDKGEPHYFNGDFDPFQVSSGLGASTVTTYAGGKDPCSLISPAVNLPTIIDPKRNHQELLLVPHADPNNPDLAGYPKEVSGNFVQARIEVSNGTDYNWINTSVTPRIGPELGATQLVMSYVAYPRPLVPAQVDPATGAVIRGGDDLGTFRAGWRFNQPEGEVLVKMGDTLPLMQPSRRAYFVFLFRVDDALTNGIYDIAFDMGGEMRHYNGTLAGALTHEVPTCMFSISPRDSKGNVQSYQKFVIGQGRLGDVRTSMVSPNLAGLRNVRWSAKDITYTNFDTLRNALPASFDPATGVETIDLSRFGAFPTADTTRLYALEQAQATSYSSVEALEITAGESLSYSYEPFGEFSLTGKALSITTAGPKLIMYKTALDAKGKPLPDTAVYLFEQGAEKEISVRFELTNLGTAVAENTTLEAPVGPYFTPVAGKLPPGCTERNGILEARLGPVLPGETKRLTVKYAFNDAACACVYDSSALLRGTAAEYRGTYAVSGKSRTDLFRVPDNDVLRLPAHDFQLERLVASHGEAQAGQTMNLNAKFVNGAAPAKNVKVGFYARLNSGDTLLFETLTLETVEALSKFVISAGFTVPDTAACLEFFARIDPCNLFGEVCEKNNSASVTVPLKGPNWILDVSNHPNPLREETVFSWLLPRDLKDLKLVLTALDGREIARLEKLPAGIGRHNLQFGDPLLPSGTYIYRFEGLDSQGVLRTHTGRLVKVQ